MDSSVALLSAPVRMFRQQQLLCRPSVPSSEASSVYNCRRSLSLSFHSHAHSHGACSRACVPRRFLRLQRQCTIISASSSTSAVPSDSPPSPSPSLPVSDIVWPASGAFVAMLAMSYMDKLVAPMGLAFTIAPFGAVCAILFATPTAPAAKKYNVFVAHIGCAAMGIVALALFGPGSLARGTALAASIAFMQLTGSMHPPAAGLPLLFIDVPKFHQLQLWYLIFPSAVGCILLCLLQEVVQFLKKTYRF